MIEEKLDDVLYFLQNSPSKSLRCLSQQASIGKTNAWKATKLLKFHPYKLNVVQQIKPVDYDKRVRFCNWFNTQVHDGILGPQLTFFTNEAWFSLSGYVNSQNRRHWCADNPNIIFELPLHNQKIGVLCAISARRILGPIFFEGILNSQKYVEEILNPFFSNLSEAEQMYGFFMQDGATAHTAGTSITALRDVYGDRLIYLLP